MISFFMLILFSFLIENKIKKKMLRITRLKVREDECKVRCCMTWTCFFITSSSTTSSWLIDLFKELFLQIKLQIAQCLVTFFLLFFYTIHLSTCEWLRYCIIFNSFLFLIFISFSHAHVHEDLMNCTFKCNYVFMTWKINIEKKKLRLGTLDAFLDVLFIVISIVMWCAVMSFNC